MNKHKVTLDWLILNNACNGGVSFVTAMQLINTNEKYFIDKLIDYGQINWSIWLLSRRLTHTKLLKLTQYIINDFLLFSNEKNKELGEVLLILNKCVKRNCLQNRKQVAHFHNKRKNKKISALEKLSKSKTDDIIDYITFLIMNKSLKLNATAIFEIIIGVTYCIKDVDVANKKTISYVQEGVKLL